VTNLRQDFSRGQTFRVGGEVIFSFLGFLEA